MIFGLGPVLTVHTGKLLCEIGELYSILNHMTGDNLMTHQLPRAGRECEPYIVEQFPQLLGITGDDITTENAVMWLEEKKAIYGDTFDVSPIPSESQLWVQKAALAAQGGATVVLLVPARTDTRWFHEWVMPFANEIRFVKGRICFSNKGRSTFPSIVVIFRPEEAPIKIGGFGGGGSSAE